MNQTFTVSEDEVIEHLLAMYDAGASEQDMRAYVHATKIEGYGFHYVELLRSLSLEREKMTPTQRENTKILDAVLSVRVVTGEQKSRYSPIGEQWMHFFQEKVLTFFTPMLSWKYAVPGVAVVVLASSLWLLNGKEGGQVASNTLPPVPQEKVTDDGDDLQSKVVDQGGVTGGASVQKSIVSSGAQSAGEDDIERIALAISESEEEESFADEDEAFDDMDADEVLLDNDQMYDEKLF